MTDKYKNKYCIESSRLQGYDYSQNGLYFVTICTKDREHFFGRMENGKMVLNEMGKIVREELLQTPIMRPNVFLDEWVIMPNHLHVIMEILFKIELPHTHVETPNTQIETPNTQIETPNAQIETPRRGVSTTMGNDKPKRGGYNPNWKPNSLGSIINQIKSISTKKIWKSGSHTFAWQSRFYDHIIRNEKELNRIREYIKSNFVEWERDRNNLENLWM